MTLEDFNKVLSDTRRNTLDGFKLINELDHNEVGIEFTKAAIAGTLTDELREKYSEQKALRKDLYSQVKESIEKHLRLLKERKPLLDSNFKNLISEVEKLDKHPRTIEEDEKVLEAIDKVFKGTGSSYNLSFPLQKDRLKQTIRVQKMLNNDTSNLEKELDFYNHVESECIQYFDDIKPVLQKLLITENVLINKIKIKKKLGFE